MKRYFHLLLLLILPLAAAGQTLSSFTVEQAVQYAREHSAPLLNSRLSRQISVAEVGRLQRQWQPQVSGTADFRYNPILQTTLLPAEFVGGTPGKLEEVRFGTNFSSTLAVLVQQKVYDPVFRLQRERLELDGRQAALEEQYEQQLAELQVVAAYYQVVLSQEIYQNTQSLLASLGQLRHDVQVRVEEGLADPVILNNLTQQYRQQQAQAVTDSLNGEIALAGLKLEMNFPADNPLQLVDSVAVAWSDTLSLNPDDNLDLQKIGLQLEQSRNTVARLKQSRLPTVNAEGYLGAQFYSNNPEFYDLSRWYGLSYIGLTANVPLYDGGDKSEGEQIEQLRMEQLRNQSAAYRRQQENKSARIALQLERSRVQARLAEQAMETARQNLELARFNYTNGEAGFQPVYDALQALVQARGQLLSAKASYVQALLEGRLLDI